MSQSMLITITDTFERSELGDNWTVDDGTFTIVDGALFGHPRVDSTIRRLVAPELQLPTTFQNIKMRATVVGQGGEQTPAGDEVWGLQTLGVCTTPESLPTYLVVQWYANGRYILIGQQLGNSPMTVLAGSELNTTLDPAGQSGIVLRAEVDGPVEAPTVRAYVYPADDPDPQPVFDATVTPAYPMDGQSVNFRFRSHNGGGMSLWQASVMF